MLQWVFRRWTGGLSNPWVVLQGQMKGYFHQLYGRRADLNGFSFHQFPRPFPLAARVQHQGHPQGQVTAPRDSVSPRTALEVPGSDPNPPGALQLCAERNRTAEAFELPGAAREDEWRQIFNHQCTQTGILSALSHGDTIFNQALGRKQ